MHAIADMPSDDAPDRPGRWFHVAAALLVLAGFAATFCHAYNLDLYWHLAGGEWMLDHGRVLGHDPFSVDPEPRWVNVHWLFQLTIAVLHRLGGVGLLCLLKAALAAGTLAAFAVSLRRVVSPAWVLLCGLLVLAVIEVRVRIRPEAVTLLLLAVTVALTEHVRRGGPAKRLWAMLPIMAVWVNMHGLYVLGPAVFWSAVLGAAIDRRLRGTAFAGPLASKAAAVPLLAATAVCLATPWPLEAAAQPLLLWTRISGGREAFTRGVSEFLPTHESGYYLGLAAAVLIPAALACALNRRRVPVAHLVWLAAFGALAMLARRNVALTGPVAGYVLGLHGGAWLRRRGLLRPGGRPAAAVGAVAGVLAVAVVAGCGTEWLFRVRGITRRFGAGLYRPNYPLALARRLGELDAPGAVFCADWGYAGTFIHHSRRRVWMDGRLEAHSLKRYLSQGRLAYKLRTVGGAEEAAFHPDLRFFYVRARSRDHLTALSASPRFRLLWIDTTGAIFARTDYRGGGTEDAGMPPTGADLGEFDHPLGRDWRVGGLAVEPRRWYRQNPPDEQYRVGTLLLWLGWRSPGGPDGVGGQAARARRTVLAARYLRGALEAGLTARDVAAGMLAQAHQQRAVQDDATVCPAVPVDFHSARALALYRSLDLSDLADENARGFAEQRVDALLRARRLDAATEAARRLLAGGPAEKLPTYRRMHEALADRLARSRRAAEALSVEAPLARAAALAGAGIGLADTAIAELRAASPTPANRRLLGDMLLNAGDVPAALDAYRQGAGAGGLALRRALCDAVAGRHFAALAALDACERTPTVSYYRGLLLELLGRYDEALAAVGPLAPEDENLAALVSRLRGRLILR